MITDDSMKIISPPGPNRAQRRLKARQSRREARHRLTVMRSAMRVTGYDDKQCPRCKLQFLGMTANRCQCQVQRLRACAICHKAFMASQRSWRQSNACAECTKALGESRANEEASASAAYDAYYARRRWDDAQHRLAQEEREIQ